MSQLPSSFLPNFILQIYAKAEKEKGL